MAQTERDARPAHSTPRARRSRGVYRRPTCHRERARMKAKRDQISRVDSARGSPSSFSPLVTRRSETVREAPTPANAATDVQVCSNVADVQAIATTNERTDGSGRGVVRRECVSLSVCFRMTSFVDDEPSTRRSSRAQNSLPAVRLSFDPMRPSIPFFFFFPALATSPPGGSRGP